MIEWRHSCLVMRIFLLSLPHYFRTIFRKNMHFFHFRIIHFCKMSFSSARITRDVFCCCFFTRFSIMTAFSTTIANRSYLPLRSPVVRFGPLARRFGPSVVLFWSGPLIFVATWFVVSHPVDFLVGYPGNR